MWLKINVLDLDDKAWFGMAGGISFLVENEKGKCFMRRLSDLSYMV